MKLFRLLIFAISVCVFISSCAKRQGIPDSDNKSKINHQIFSISDTGIKSLDLTDKEKQIVEIAKKACMKKGYRFEDCEITIKFNNREKVWVVNFNPGFPGGDAMVTVDEASGNVVFTPGLI